MQTNPFFITNRKDKFEKIDKQLEGSNTTRANIIEYYIEKVIY